MNQTDGLLVLDKPAGATSHDIVARCRRIFGQRKVGHAGTLDPGATGVLLVGLGQVTRLLQFLTGLPKRYTAEVVLGQATTTLDADGQLTGTWDMTEVDLDAARAAAGQLTGRVLQVPPMVSALKVQGKRLHELARQGVEIERAPRPVTISRFEVGLAGAGPHGPVLAIDVECSSGTYVRTLAADLGQLLGGGAHLRNLRRLRVGDFSIEESASLDALEAQPVALRPLEALRGMARVTAAEDLAAAVAHGKVLPAEALRLGGQAGTGPWAIVGRGDVLLAVYQSHRPGFVKPVVVMLAQ